MKHRLKRTTRSLAILTIIYIFLLTGVILYIRNEFENSTVYNRKKELQRLVTIGLNSIRQYRDDYASGAIPKEEALKRMTDQVRHLTYPDETQPNYLFMSSYDGIMLVQPYEPEKEGTDQWDLQDADGKYIIRELVKTAREGSGFVVYKYFPPESDIPTNKLSYVIGLPEFECYIGTGMYSSDIENIVQKHFRSTMILVSIMIFVLIGCTVILVAPLFLSIQYIAEKFLELGSGPVNEKPDVDIHMFRTGSDAQKLVQGFAEITGRLAERNKALIKKNEEHEILVKEMNHRVKNNLQIIISLLQLQLTQHEDPSIREPFLETISRLESISIIHNMLYSNENYSYISAAKYLQELGEYILHSFGVEDRLQMILSADDSELTVNQAVSIGIIVNETLTNSVKYAFNDEENGIIEISFKTGNGRYYFSIGDNGKGLPENYIDGTASGLGINLIRNLSAQLNAEFEIDNSEGTLYKFIFS